MPKKRVPASESPFSPEMMSAITKELPALLAKEGYLKNPTSAPAPKVVVPAAKPAAPKIAEREERAAPRLPDPVPRGNRRALWYSVALFGVLIIAVWIFNIRAIFAGLLQTESSAALVNQGKNDLTSILETIKQNDKIAQDRLRAAEAAALAKTATSTGATATSTEADQILNNLAEAIKAEQTQ